MKVYPYKTEDGYCSILEAIDMEDAASWLSKTSKGAEFCEIEIEDSEFRKILFQDVTDDVNKYLKNADVTVTVG